MSYFFADRATLLTPVILISLIVLTITQYISPSSTGRVTHIVGPYFTSIAKYNNSFFHSFRINY
jgi:hypothetical protein